MNRIALYGWVAVIAAFLYLGWAFVSRRTPGVHLVRTAPGQSVSGVPSWLEGPKLRVVQFYAASGELTEGEQEVLCYGVVNAKRVRIEPGFNEVFPSLNRCLEIEPEEDTTYTITAEGENGESEAVSLLVRVKPDPYTLPRITQFGVARQLVDRGRPVYLLSFSTENAEMVKVDPPVIPPIYGPVGRFYVLPEKTTTYTLTAVGAKNRRAERSITLNGPP
jgi:hypothetical protein